jgi:hypothetical protein
MVKTDFDRFVEQQHKRSLDQEVNWPQKLEEWLSSLDDLYQTVEGYLSEYKRDGTVDTTYSLIDINEDYIGSYKARRLLITVGSKNITLVPVARFVIGSMGRVDIEGSAGRSRLIRVGESVTGVKVTVTILSPGDSAPKVQPPKEERIVWKIVAPPPRMEFLALSKDSFLTTLIEVSNG